MPDPQQPSMATVIQGPGLPLCHHPLWSWTLCPTGLPSPFDGAGGGKGCSPGQRRDEGMATQQEGLNPCVDTCPLSVPAPGMSVSPQLPVLEGPAFAFLGGHQGAEPSLTWPGAPDQAVRLGWEGASVRAAVTVCSGSSSEHPNMRQAACSRAQGSLGPGARERSGRFYA